MVGITVTSIFGALALYHLEWILACVLLSTCAIFTLSKDLVSHAKHQKVQKLASILLTNCLIALMLYLVVTGGVENTGPLWIYIVPHVAMFLGGFIIGIVINLLFTATICLLLFFPNEALLLTSYPFAFKVRLVASFCTVTFLSAYYEYSRQKTFETVQQLSDKFASQALHDPLTSLLNRRGAQQQLNNAYARTTRTGSPLSVVLCDIDYFKKINDGFGHDAGDKVLVETAQHFKKNIRGQDLVARWGGEEFLFMLPDTDGKNAKYLAEKIRASYCDNEITYKDSTISVTASFGVCEITPSISLTQALSYADKEMYAAKNRGRNQVSVYQSVDN